MSEETTKKFPRWPLYVTLGIGLLIGFVYSFGMLMAVTSRHKTKDVGSFKMEYSNRGEFYEGKDAIINLLVTSDNKPKDVKLAYYSLNVEEARPTMVFKTPAPKKPFNLAPMYPAGNTGFYTATLVGMKMDEQYYFYIIMTDDAGASHIYPKGADAPDAKIENITFRRESVLWVTALHIAMMVMTVLFLLHILYYGLMHLATSQFPIMKAVLSSFWANLFFFITSFPIGCYVAYVAYGRPWTGIPEVMDPNDVDNKSLMIFVYWVVILILIKGVGSGKNKISSKAFAVLSILGSILTIYFFLSGGHN
ncbi:MAG: hypothetical protein WC980_01175 [Candidatus Brocadiia bacterium]